MSESRPSFYRTTNPHEASDEFPQLERDANRGCVFFSGSCYADARLQRRTCSSTERARVYPLGSRQTRYLLPHLDQETDVVPKNLCGSKTSHRRSRRVLPADRYTPRPGQPVDHRTADEPIRRAFL